MAYTQQEFEKIVEAVSEELAAVIEEKLKTVTQKVAETVAEKLKTIDQQVAEIVEEKLTSVTTDVNESLVTFAEWMLQRQQKTATNPLEFYETILKIHGLPLISEEYEPLTRPYFGYVFNDVFRYLGGANSLKARQFLAEACKRFAYCTFEMDGHRAYCISSDTWLVSKNAPATIMFLTNGSPNPRLVPYTQHDFDVLRQLLQELCVEEEAQQSEETPHVQEEQQEEVTSLTAVSEIQERSEEQEQISEPREKKLLSADLADMLRRLE